MEPSTSGSQQVGLANSREEQYKTIVSYENHFNSLEADLRKLASVWLLTALGAIAFLVTQSPEGTLIDAKIMIAIVALMGNTGLLILWILDHLVYHRLLNSVFLLGLRMEFLDPRLPPIRTLMMLFSRKRGMARFLQLFYLLPMFCLAAVSLAAGVWQGMGADPRQFLPVVPGVAAALIPAWVVWRGAHLESYVEIAAGFGDAAFTRFLHHRSYEELLRGR